MLKSHKSGTKSRDIKVSNKKHLIVLVLCSFKVYKVAFFGHKNDWVTAEKLKLKRTQIRLEREKRKFATFQRRTDR